MFRDGGDAVKVLFVDPNPEELAPILQIRDVLSSFELVGEYRNAADALRYAREHRDIDLVILETELPDAGGLLLALQLRRMIEGLVVIFVTNHPEHTADALRQKADYVAFKPLSREDAADVLRRAWLLLGRREKPVYARTFGPFDLQAGGRSVRFRSAKAKELMALLICYAGKPLSIHEIVDCLWEGDEFADVKTVGYRKAIKNLTDTLTEYGIDSILERTRGYCRLNTEIVDSDYYGFIRGDARCKQEFHGVFLPEYAWAEEYIYPLLEVKTGGE